MKKSYLILFFYLLLRMNISAHPVNEGDNKIGGENEFQIILQDNSAEKISSINELDTVVFDLSQSILDGNYVEFPVYIHSDDSIFSLDFSFKYDHANLQYDTIFDLTNYFQSLSYYNTFDSTVRYTSNSFQNYGIDTVLVSIRFITLSGQIHIGDLNDLNAYLNGSSCSIKVINSLPTVVGDLNRIRSNLKVFPNPVSDVLNINTEENVSIQLLDINSRKLFLQTTILAGQNIELRMQEYENGIYLLKIFNENFLSTKKIIIDK